MPIRQRRGDAAAQRALQVTLLNQVRLQHIFNGVALLADGRRKIINAHRPAAELVDHRAQQFAIHDVEADAVNVEHLQRLIGNILGDLAVGAHLGEIAHAAQQPVGNARRAARACGHFTRTCRIDLDFKQTRRAFDDAGQFSGTVELEPGDDTEAVAQRIGQHTGARGCADQRERRQVQLYRARRGALTDHDVDLEILQRGIEDFFDHRRQAVDFVDEQHVIRFEIGQHRREVTRAFDHRARGMAQIDAHLAGDDMRQRGLAEAGRAEQQHVIQRFLALARRLDEDRQLAAHLFLPDVFVQRLRSQRALDHLFLHGSGCCGNQAVGFNHRQGLRSIRI